MDNTLKEITNYSLFGGGFLSQGIGIVLEGHLRHETCVLFDGIIHGH